MRQVEGDLHEPMEQLGQLRWSRCEDPEQEPRVLLQVEERINSVLESWRDTPYRLNQCVKGAGVDCIRFVCAVNCELYRRPMSSLPTLPADTALFNREGTIAVFRAVLRSFPGHVFLSGDTVQPGDTIITAKPNRGPGHSLIVSSRPNVLWHSMGDGVHPVGIGVLGSRELQYRVFRIIRMRDRTVWA